MSRDHRIPWHTLLGQALADALNGLPYNVSTEEELALRSQRLDLLIIKQHRPLQDFQRARSAKQPSQQQEDQRLPTAASGGLLQRRHRGLKPIRREVSLAPQAAPLSRRAPVRQVARREREGKGARPKNLLSPMPT
ncbi:hypothetical protein CCR96_15190 [Halochromatium roseum]|nr:hypothetical protein [Halochromatium roseum]